jgi:hypothetical protein
MTEQRISTQDALDESINVLDKLTTAQQVYASNYLYERYLWTEILKVKKHQSIQENFELRKDVEKALDDINEIRKELFRKHGLPSLLVCEEYKKEG